MIRYSWEGALRHFLRPKIVIADVVVSLGFGKEPQHERTINSTRERKREREHLNARASPHENTRKFARRVHKRA